MTRIGFVGPLAASFADAVRARMTEPFEFVTASEADIVAHMPELDVLVSLVFTREMAATARRLKLVQVPGAGLDRIDRSALPSGASLANAHGHEIGIAEFVLGAMLALTRDFGRLDGSLRRGVWESQWAPDKPAPPVLPELCGKTIGILGYGRIGKAVGDRARAFGMKVYAVKRSPERSSQDGLSFLGGLDALEKVLRESDYVVTTLPLSNETENLLDARAFACMKPTGILVNVGRAGVVNESALYDALRNRTIAAAAIDVWYRYPSGKGPSAPSDRPFHELPNILMTPHIAGWTEGMLAERAGVIVENVRRLRTGEPLLNRIQ